METGNSRVRLRSVGPGAESRMEMGSCRGRWRSVERMGSRLAGESTGSTRRAGPRSRAWRRRRGRRVAAFPTAAAVKWGALRAVNGVEWGTPRAVEAAERGAGGAVTAAAEAVEGTLKGPGRREEVPDVVGIAEPAGIC